MQANSYKEQVFVWFKLTCSRLKDYLSGKPRLVLWAKILLVFLIFCFACYSTLDLDFGWHLQAGNYIRSHGIPAHDIFTYTARNYRWIDHEWGNDVLTSILYQYTGYLGLAVLFAALWTAGLFINARRTRLVFILLGAAAMLPYVVIRPTAWDVCGLALVVAIFNAKSKKLIWFLPLVILIWANLHGGFVLGLAVILYYLFMRRELKNLFMFFCCVLISFINPYGPRLYVVIFQTLTDWSLHSQTKGMTILLFLYPSWPLILLWAGGFWTVARNKLRNWLGLEPLLLLASMAATRAVPLFSILAVPKTDEYYHQMAAQVPKKALKLSRLIITCSGCVLVLASAFIIYSSLPFANREASFPVQEVSYLKRGVCRGNLFNDFDYGGYLIWQLPSKPVFIDGRMPSWKNSQGVKYLNIYFDIVTEPKIRLEEFKKYNITCALVENNAYYQPFIRSLESSGWYAPVRGNGGILLMAPQQNSI